jgi:hypothetical protein
MVKFIGFAVPAASPSHREKTDPAFAVAVSEIVAAVVNVSLQSAPQLMPEGELIVPEPNPIFMTFSSAVRTGMGRRIARKTMNAEAEAGNESVFIPFSNDLIRIRRKEEHSFKKS